MALDDLELLVCELALLVQDLRGNLDLADVVQQRGPAQTLQRVLAQVHLLTDHLGVRPDPLRVPTGESVVGVECGHEHQQALGCLGRGLSLHTVPGLLDGSFESLGGARQQRDPVARRGLVREHQRQPEQRRQRQQPTGDPFDEQVDGQGQHEHRRPPSDRPGARWTRDARCREPHGRCRQQRRGAQGHQTEQGRATAVCPPTAPGLLLSIPRSQRIPLLHSHRAHPTIVGKHVPRPHGPLDPIAQAPASAFRCGPRYRVRSRRSTPRWLPRPRHRTTHHRRKRPRIRR